ncbi:hypothetical protein FH972_008947 [Carpinus fangiana]|uniref:Uncharacterized protein n=1 Tax=Carpinus fangiana TaxID=176857 RepID=A0A5N6R3E0_9ROSI|nr:hypothetical protein FH972_008947 [Carpinus fangiana]
MDLLVVVGLSRTPLACSSLPASGDPLLHCQSPEQIKGRGEGEIAIDRGEEGFAVVIDSMEGVTGALSTDCEWRSSMAWLVGSLRSSVKELAFSAVGTDWSGIHPTHLFGKEKWR